MKVLDKEEKEIYNAFMNTIKMKKLKIKSIKPPEGFEGW